MEWSWMVEEFVWIILSPRERTHLHQASTWADQLIAAVEEEVVEVVVEVEAVADDVILTMIEDMSVGMTDMKTMITGTEEDHLLLTIVDIDHDQGLVPTAQDAIDRMIAVEDIFSFSLFLLCCLIPDFPKLLILSTS